MSDRRRALLVANGALVFLAGMLAGFPFASAILSGQSDVRAWRMAHLEGTLNGLTLIAIAAITPLLTLRERTHTILFWSLIITAWGNILGSLIGPLFNVRGLTIGGSVANTLMYLLFLFAVVAILVALALVAVGAVRRAQAPRP